MKDKEWRYLCILCINIRTSKITEKEHIHKSGQFSKELRYMKTNIIPLETFSKYEQPILI